jgi:Carboxypeptidase regulatory-like domain
MGPSLRKNNAKRVCRITFQIAGLMCGLLLIFAPLLAQAQRPDELNKPAARQPQALPATGSISGTVLDATGAPVGGALVRLAPASNLPAAETRTAPDGHFSFSNVAPSPFDVRVTLAGFKTRTVSGVLPANQDYFVPAITLELAPVVTDVSVRLTTAEVAQEQIKVQEQQKLIAVIPNYYASYVYDAAPLNPKQKFELAWKLVIDPSSFVIAGIIAGGEQASNSFPGYGQGAAGYFNRFGAAYGDFFIGTYISNAILPSLLKQDPRYFYKGTGTKKSRLVYALKRSVMARGDNGHWQPDYSGLLGSLAAGGISNLYYPEGSRHGFGTTVNNTLIGIGTNAGVNILQEFVFRKVTPKVPKTDPPTT